MLQDFKCLIFGWGCVEGWNGGRFFKGLESDSSSSGVKSRHCPFETTQLPVEVVVVTADVFVLLESKLVAK